ncbi:hypothetical protein [Rhizobium leucaenae]|uniref:hypothetical protein n=1 Tax=Rhizobium leucaenae TaxID=29450 RepID=UPI00048FF334|nr:hypothetical protein [Rhizobium leucaenae]
MGVPAPALNLVERSIWERRGIRRSVVKTGLNAYAPGRYPTFARATGVSWMLGIGRLGSILGSSIGGLLLGFGWDFRGIFCALAVPAADRRGGNPDQRTAIDAATSTTSDEIIAHAAPIGAACFLCNDVDASNTRRALPTPDAGAIEPCPLCVVI